MTKHQVVIERPVVEAQAAYDELCQVRRDLSGKVKLRQESLENIPRFKTLSKEMAATRLSRKNVAAKFDDENPGIKSSIDSKKDHIDAIESKLTGIALEHFKKTGTMLEVLKTNRNGSQKKIRIGFAFRQLSLF